MNVIIPALLPVSKEDLASKLARVKTFAKDIQLDMVDGRFITPASWPYSENQNQKLNGRQSMLSSMKDILTEADMLPYVDQLSYEIDLMVTNPEDITGEWIECGASRLTIHVESSKYLAKALEELKTKYGHAKDFVPGMLSVGLAINITTDLAILEPFIHDIDYVQFMGIAVIGKQGQPFDDKVLRKIAQFRQKHPDMLVQVDGGVSLKTAPALLSAGVDRLIVGSALWNTEDPAAEYHKFEELVHEYGVYS